MPKNHSYKRTTDAAIFSLWDTHPEAVFTQLGLTREALKAAQSAMVGRIVMPGDPSYDTDRLLTNPVFNPAPCVIIYCESESDVGIALQIGKRGTMPFTIRSGGHCTAGFSAGYGVLIDVKGLDHVVVDPAMKTATVGAGCDFARLNRALALYGLHVPSGECDTVRVGGFVQGGGLGFTAASFGMNCDNVLSMKVMLADGRIVIATPNQNRDLWWAMRGGTGGNFGILLEVVYQLYPLKQVTGWALAWTLETPAQIALAADVMLRLQRDYMGPNGVYGDALTLQVLIVYQTELQKGVPMPTPGYVFMVRGLWVGNPQDAIASMKPLAAMPGATVQWTKTGTYMEVLDALLNDPQDQPIVAHGMPNEDKASRYVAKDLSAAEWIEVLTFFTTKSPNTMSYMYLEVYGGKIASYPLENSAFVHRDVLYDAVLDVFWYMPGDRAAAEAFMHDWIQLMERFWNGGVYQNYPSISVPDYPHNYWKSALPGLKKVRQKYDPGHSFRFAQEVPVPLSDETPGPDEIPADILAALALPIDEVGGAQPIRLAL
ncbi:FAD-binding oxidoreductase [Sedimentimonas flavescens]|uniref:FAD-binding oxidoreductase n=1 Tax=Sedimentimonas flavescens TaxID=2851012 RepID=A0ABT2ZZV2_9RHOB|nr:FAD-binding oxidoreductase [Sedimentimonas flavescens]MCV2879286.1 FAD-binding oxidoreductase [Sedimentimonas flavescens]